MSGSDGGGEGARGSNVDDHFLRSTTYDTITAATRSCIVYANGRFRGSGGSSSGDEEESARPERIQLNGDEPTVISLHFNERPLRDRSGHRNAAHLAENGAKMADSWLTLFSGTAGEALPGM